MMTHLTETTWGDIELTLDNLRDNFEHRELVAQVSRLKDPRIDDPSIYPHPAVYLPTFLDQYDKDEWKRIWTGIKTMAENTEQMLFEGIEGWRNPRPSRRNPGGVQPGHNSMGNATFQRAIERDRDAVVLTHVNGTSLLDILRGTPEGGKEWKGAPWLENLIDAIEELKKVDAIAVERPHVPKNWSSYRFLTMTLRPDEVMTFSPEVGDGIYVMNSRITLVGATERGESLEPEVDLAYDDAMARFAGDPNTYLRGAGIDPSQFTPSKQKRIRLLFRDYLSATKQGRYIHRAGPGSAKAISQYALGEELAEEFLSTLDLIVENYVVTEDVEIILDGKNCLLEAGDSLIMGEK